MDFRHNMPRGFTLTELQVALVISAIMILAVAAISQISSRAYSKLRQESEVYADLGFAMKMMRNRVRESSLVSVDESPADPVWVGHEVLRVDNGAFGMYRPVDGAAAEFVYVPNIADTSKRETLLQFGADFDTGLFDFKAENGVVTIYEINGNKDGVPFVLPEVTIKRRTS
ncbi:MAG: prepilin-type N-terminal cleavage/methylation domain-containing protein [Candidatus Omnitrophica bacterium]|nr:prepilin-type N-terminal cleavage/methylation domain-containing protein [Candidatus Omnitrophota bacterium]